MQMSYQDKAAITIVLTLAHIVALGPKFLLIIAVHGPLRIWCYEPSLTHGFRQPSPRLLGCALVTGKFGLLAGVGLSSLETKHGLNSPPPSPPPNPKP